MFHETLCMQWCTMWTQLLSRKELLNSRRRSLKATSLHVAQTGCTPSMVTMGYQNSTFPIAVYGCMDMCSRKILWIRVWMSNSDPNIIGRFYLEHLFKSRKIAAKLRLDRGLETGVMATMHAFLRQHHGDMDPLETVIYGPSTSNQVRFADFFYFLCFYFNFSKNEKSQIWT